MTERGKIGRRFDNPYRYRSRWPSFDDYHRGRSSYIDSETIGETPIREIVRLKLERILFPEKHQELTAVEALAMDSYRKRLHLYQPDDPRIALVAGLFTGFAYAVGTVEGLFGGNMQTALNRNDLTPITPGTLRVTCSNDFRPGLRSSYAQTKIAFTLDGRVVTDIGEITAENVSRVQVSAIDINLNLARLLELLAVLGEEVENRVREEAIETVDKIISVGKMRKQQREEAIEVYTRHLVTANISQKLTGFTLDNISAIADSAAVEEVMHARHIMKMSETPEGLLELVREASNLARDPATREAEYAANPFERAVKKWTLEMLVRYYPAQTEMIDEIKEQIAEGDRHRRAYLQRLRRQGANQA